MKINILKFLKLPCWHCIETTDMRYMFFYLQIQCWEIAINKNDHEKTLCHKKAVGYTLYLYTLFS